MSAIDRPASAAAIRPFAFEATEAELDNLRGTSIYPVAISNDYEVWSAFDNHHWPALYFVDSARVIRDHHFVEGRCKQSEHVIPQVLGIERESVPA